MVKINGIGLSIVAAATILNTLHADSVDIGEVSVTATKTEKLTSESPASVSIISNKDLEQKNVSRVTDALQTVPSLNMSAGPFNGQMSQGVGGGTFTFRGMDSSRTAVLIDGKSMTDGFSSKVDFRTILVDDVEKIEVVPGAFSSLYGSNAIGGVINIITKEPTKPETTIKYKRGFGDASGNDYSIYHRNKSENGIGVVLGYGHQERDGYENEFVTKTPSGTGGTTAVTGGVATTNNSGTPTFIIGDKGKSSWKQDNVVVKINYDLDEYSKVYGGVAYNTYETKQEGYNSYLRDASGNIVSSATDLTFDNTTKFSLKETDFASSTPLEQGDLRKHIGYEGLIYNNYDVKLEISHIDRTSWYNLRTTGAFSDGGGKNNSSPSETLDILAQVEFELNSYNNIVMGLSQRNTELNREVYNLSNWRNENSKTTLEETVDGKSSNSSVFIQDEISIGESFVVYAGGRYDNWTTEGSNYKVGVYDDTFTKRTDSAFSPKLSVVYLPTKDITLRASAGNSFRAPDNYQLYGTLYCCSTYYLSNPDLKPETATSYELGAEWRVNPKFKTGISLYQTTLKDMIFNKTIDATHTKANNAGEAQVRGLELTVNSSLNDWMDLDLSYSKTDSEMLKNDAAPATVGNKLAYTPEMMWSAVLSGKYEKWSGLIEVKHTGKSFNNIENTQTVEGVFGATDSFTMTNMKVGYQIGDNVKFNLAINNVTDEEVYQYYLLPGRNATAELVLKF